MNKQSAARRHLVWTAGLVALLIAPVISAALPSWDVLPASASPATVTPITKAVDLPAAMKTTAASLDLAEVSPAAISAPMSLWLGIWTCGAGLLVARLLVGQIKLIRKARRARAVIEGDLADMAEQLRGQFGIARSVRLVLGDPCAMPMTWGTLRPVLLLPAEADTWEPARQHAVLCHELAHIKRGDAGTGAIAHLACAMHWFNPLVWFAARRADIERERACDDLVLAQGWRASDYAGHLLHVVTGSLGRPALGAVAMAAKRSNIHGRIEAILREDLNRHAASRRASLGLMALALCVALPVMLVSVKAQTPAGAPAAAEKGKVAVKIDPAELATPPDGTYELGLLIAGERVDTKWLIKDGIAMCVEAGKAPGARVLKGAKGRFRMVGPGSFQIVARGEGFTANQTWAFQSDGSAKVLEVPDRGENQRAVPIAGQAVKSAGNPDDAAAAPKFALTKLTTPPEGTYELGLLIAGERVDTKWLIKDGAAMCVEAGKAPGARVLKGAKGRFRMVGPGSFQIVARGEGFTANQTWAFQPDGSAKVLEVPDRGEKQRAVPIAGEE